MSLSPPIQIGDKFVSQKSAENSFGAPSRERAISKDMDF
jgi:hypothetical protein